MQAIDTGTAFQTAKLILDIALAVSYVGFAIGIIFGIGVGICGMDENIGLTMTAVGIGLVLLGFALMVVAAAVDPAVVAVNTPV